jgi:hypothetical protein
MDTWIMDARAQLDQRNTPTFSNHWAPRASTVLISKSVLFSHIIGLAIIDIHA